MFNENDDWVSRKELARILDITITAVSKIEREFRPEVKIDPKKQARYYRLSEIEKLERDRLPGRNEISIHGLWFGLGYTSRNMVYIWIRKLGIPTFKRRPLIGPLYTLVSLKDAYRIAAHANRELCMVSARLYERQVLRKVRNRYAGNRPEVRVYRKKDGVPEHLRDAFMHFVADVAEEMRVRDDAA